MLARRTVHFTVVSLSSKIYSKNICLDTVSVRKMTSQMTQRTFDDATSWPPLKPDTLRLYSMRFCPYAQRARLVLAHKNIPYETVNVHLKRKPEWLLRRNPKGRVPVLEHPDGRIVFESLVVSQYLDEIYPQNRLIATDSYRKARDQMIVDYSDRLMKAFYQLLFTDGASEEARNYIQRGFRIYEKELKMRLPDGPFFGGKQPCIADYMVWPWMERLPMFENYTGDDNLSAKNPSTANDTAPSRPSVAVTAAHYPLVHRWMAAMFELPAVKETMFDLKSHRRFGRSQLTADPDYDMGLENEPPLPLSSSL